MNLMLTCAYYIDCRIYKNIQVYNNTTMYYYNMPACGTGGSIDEKVTIVKILAKDKFMYIAPFLFNIPFPHAIHFFDHRSSSIQHFSQFFISLVTF